MWLTRPLCFVQGSRKWLAVRAPRDADKSQSSQMSRGLRSSVRLADMCRHVQTVPCRLRLCRILSLRWHPPVPVGGRSGLCIRRSLNLFNQPSAQHTNSMKSYEVIFPKPKDVHLLDLKVIAVSFVLEII